MNILRKIMKVCFNENIKFSPFAFLMFILLLPTPPLVFIPLIFAVLLVDVIVRKSIN